MHIDTLSIIETFERAAEWSESSLRRHARTILLALGGLAIVAASVWWAPLAARMQPPQSRPEARQRPIAAASRAPTPQPRPSAATPRPGPSASAAPFIFVHVAGAVARPGVIRLASGARAFQAVAAAGGPLAEADLNRVNLARRLQDEAMLVIPRQGEPTAEPSPTPGGAPAAEPEAPAGETGKATVEQLEQHPLHVNEADAQQLQRVPGIGPALAGAIVAWRRQHGRFERVDDLRRVPRFGERLLARTRRCFVP